MAFVAEVSFVSKSILLTAVQVFHMSRLKFGIAFLRLLFVALALYVETASSVYLILHHVDIYVF